MSKRSKYKKLDWAKFADFASRNTRDSLADLCNDKSTEQLVEIFSTRDESGLYPIHWAAIHNRSDLIEFMVDHGSPLKVKCRNKLFADGSSLHLAAMNGSIEAASMLLHKCAANQTGVKSIGELKDDDIFLANRFDEPIRWLRQRDSDGQTPLMKCAPPKSKRLNTVRDLLRKNLWSLSGRPAEMAMFLICKGADWRETDTINNMNLFHLAIINEYEDIINLLMVIDKDIVNLPVKIREDLSPLQLAILYGRVSIISTLWHVKANEKLSKPSPAIHDSPDSQREINKLKAESRNELKRIVTRAFWSNREEVSKFFRRSMLKFLLLTDLAILAIFWIPIYATTDDEGNIIFSLRGGLFIFSFLISIALLSRVILKNPGYLRRSSLQYLKELKTLVSRREVDNEKSGQKPTEQPSDTTQQKVVPKQEVSLIELESGNREGRKTAEQANNEKQEQQVHRPNQASSVNDPQKGVVGEEESSNNNKGISSYNNKGIVALDARWQHKTDLEDRVRILCHQCRCIRRPRSRHCSYCNHCIQDYDHHCIYLGCCIGRYNRLDFLVVMVIVTITSIYGVVLHTTSLTRAEWSNFGHYIGLLWILKYTLIGGLTAFSILRRASLGVTMYEEIRADRIKKVFGPTGPPETISKSHKVYSTLKNSFWRYAPDRFLTGDLPAKSILYNLREFSNFASISEYILTIASPDTSLARSLTSSDSRVNLYRFI